MEASPSLVYGAALLMRFGLTPIRGSNPRASAPPPAETPAAGAGQKLPSETSLAYEHKVGRDTVRDALGQLRAEGLITTERGRPASVTDPAEVATITLGPRDTVDVRGGTVTVTRSGGKVETYTTGTVRIIGGGKRR